MGILLALLFFAVLAWLLLRSERPLVENTQGHWHQTIEGLFVSTPDFYQGVEAKISEWQVPQVRVERVEVEEGSALSNKRLYLRVRRFDYVYDIFAAPFGGGLFVSSWLWRNPPLPLQLLARLPLIGRRLAGWFSPQTFYALDTATLFQETTHNAVLATLDELIKTAEGVPVIPESERKPIMRELYAATIVPRAPAAR